MTAPKPRFEDSSAAVEFWLNRRAENRAELMEIEARETQSAASMLVFLFVVFLVVLGSGALVLHWVLR